MSGRAGRFQDCDTGMSLVGNLLMIMLTVLLFGAAAYYLMGFQTTDRAPITGFEVTPQNATALRIISLAGDPIPVSTAKITLGSTQFDLSGLVDKNGNHMLDPGEVAFIGAYDLSIPTRVVIASGNYLLLETNVQYHANGSLNNSSSAPAYSPGLTATYYKDEVWSAEAASNLAREIRFADDAGAGLGYASDETHWPVAEVGRDDMFSVKFDGFIKVDQEADYTFYLTSDDGSYLSVNGSQIIDNGGLHSATEKTATVHLMPGYLPITVRMSEHNGQAVARLEYSAPGMARGFVTALYHLPGSTPVADFTAVPTVANAPATVQFTDNSIDATAWAWDFGDGNTSNLQNPSHTYSANNDYTVKLTAINQMGSGTITKAGYIRLGSAVSGFTARYYKDEIWGTTAALRTVERIRFSDAAGIAIGYASDEGQWPLPEVGTDDTFSVKFDGTLKIDQEADYTFYLTSDDGSYLSIDGTQIIDNGGQHSATEKSATVHLAPGYHAIEVKMFEHAGQAVVRLEYSAPGMARTYVSAVYHDTVTPPVPDFTAAPTVSSPPASIQFTDASIDASAWSWDFGDGATSSLQSPAHTYVTAGNYTVKLTATNTVGSSTEIKPQYIRIGALAQGFKATYYSDETWSTPVNNEIVPQIRLSDAAGISVGYPSDKANWPVAEIGKDESFSVMFEGALKIDNDADYTFYLTSDDGSYLSIDGTQIIDNGGLHSAAERTGTVHLAPGYHALEVKMFEHTGEAVVRLEYSSAAMPRKFVQEAYTL